MSDAPTRDPVAFRIATETVFDYAYSKYVLDAWGGDEKLARAALNMAAATNCPAPMPVDFSVGSKP